MKRCDSHPFDEDVIDRLWIDAATRIGFRVVRVREAYASSDGAGVISIGEKSTLDADDNVAQLVLHELCHALVQGNENLDKPDWGLDNMTDRDRVREFACLRLQAHLADRHALRALFAPTTEWRSYYEELDAFPLDEDGDPAVPLAREGAKRSDEEPWAEAIAAALVGTKIAYEQKLLVDDAQPHPSGRAVGLAERTCGKCAWFYEEPRPGGGSRCRQNVDRFSHGMRVERGFRGCDLWEAAPDCIDCGACCREAFDTVAVGVRERVVWKHPSLVVRNGPRFGMRREDTRCGALTIAHSAPRFLCSIYEDRPQTCHDFQAGSARCLEARRRVGLSARHGGSP